MGGAGFHQINGNTHGRIFFTAHGEGRRFVHGDDFAGILNFDTGIGLRVLFAQFGLDGFTQADQNDIGFLGAGKKIERPK